VPDSAKTIDLPDGRTLAYAEWGDPGGRPVVTCHGTPGCRLNRHPNQDLVRSTGARVIAFDRPGYGRSTRNRGRRVVDVVDDVARLADHLGLDEFAVVGGSGGGPHALAVAALLGERITRAACIVGVAPYDVLGDEWFTGMDPMNVKEFGWALEGEEVLVPELEREAEQMIERVAADPSKLLGDEWGLSEVDRAELARPERAEVIRQNVTESFRNGVWGWADDDICFTKPWGFDLAEIRVPTRVVYGVTDVLVPAAHGEWLGRHVPNAEVVAEDELGHLASPELVTERFGWLVQ
jgi:pimeloyl-ACP methyl ester carboxylesterase